VDIQIHDIQHKINTWPFRAVGMQVLAKCRTKNFACSKQL